MSRFLCSSSLLMPVSPSVTRCPTQSLPVLIHIHHCILAPADGTVWTRGSSCKHAVAHSVPLCVGCELGLINWEGNFRSSLRAAAPGGARVLGAQPANQVRRNKLFLKARYHCHINPEEEGGYSEESLPKPLASVELRFPLWGEWCEVCCHFGLKWGTTGCPPQQRGPSGSTFVLDWRDEAEATLCKFPPQP